MKWDSDTGNVTLGLEFFIHNICTFPEPKIINWKTNEKLSKIFEPDDKGLILLHGKALKINKKSTIYNLKMNKKTQQINHRRN